jgi:hypothetical protein
MSKIKAQKTKLNLFNLNKIFFPAYLYEELFFCQIPVSITWNKEEFLKDISSLLRKYLHLPMIPCS